MLMSLSGQFARRLCTNTTHPALQKESMSQRRQSPARSCLWDCSAPRSLAEELVLVPSLLLAFQMSGHRVYMPRDRDLFLSLAPDREYNGNAGRRHSQHRHIWNQESCRFEDSKLWRSSDQAPEGTHLKWLWYCPGESRIESSFSCWNMEMRARSLGWDISVEDATDPDAWVHLAGTEGSWGGRGLVPERLWKSGVNYIAVLDRDGGHNWGSWSWEDIHHRISVPRTLHLTRGDPELPALKMKSTSPHTPDYRTWLYSVCSW